MTPGLFPKCTYNAVHIQLTIPIICVLHTMSQGRLASGANVYPTFNMYAHQLLTVRYCFNTHKTR